MNERGLMGWLEGISSKLVSGQTAFIPCATVNAVRRVMKLAYHRKFSWRVFPKVGIDKGKFPMTGQTRRSLGVLLVKIWAVTMENVVVTNLLN